MDNTKTTPGAKATASSPDASGKTSADLAQGVITFWRQVGKGGWFAKNDAVDQRFRDQFHDLHFAAARRECDHWISEPYPGLALILLLDQFPRNVFRQTAHMFATDPLARHYAKRFIDNGLVVQIDAELRLFACLPFVHSETLTDQDYAIALYQRYAPDNLGWAHNHRSIVSRFGRFPHRNASLGRVTTPDEQAFLDGGGFAG